jgi:hypothetical protein
MCGNRGDLINFKTVTKLDYSVYYTVLLLNQVTLQLNVKIFLRSCLKMV